MSFCCSSLRCHLLLKRSQSNWWTVGTAALWLGSSAYVNVWVGEERKETIGDTDGQQRCCSSTAHARSERGQRPLLDRPWHYRREPSIVQYDKSLRINAPYMLCGAGERIHSPLEIMDFNMKQILNHGYASANACGKVTASPQPGQVVLFVRPLTFLEKMKQ